MNDVLSGPGVIIIPKKVFICVRVLCGVLDVRITDVDVL